MDSNRTREVVTKLFADIAAGRLDDVLAALSPSIVFDLPGNEFNTVIPNLATWRGRDGVTEAFRLRTAYTDILEFEQREMVVDGDRAFVVNYQKLAHRDTGMAVDFEFAMMLVLGDDGLIRLWKAFFDSAPEIALFRSDIDQRLAAAIRGRRAEEVAVLLRDGADPNRREPATGLTALQIAAGLGAADVVRLLLDAGGDVYAADAGSGVTALHKAVQQGDPETVRLLLDAGSFIDAASATTGHTPLMDALWYKWPDVVELLLERGAGLGLSTHYGFSMREHFEYELNVNSVGKERLLAAEKMLAERTARDEAAVAEQRLMAAVSAGDAAGVRDEIAAEAGLEDRYPAVNGFNDAHTPLLVAARDGHTEIVAELLAAGADVHATEPTFGAGALHKAVYNGHADITRLLVAVPGIDLDLRGATNGYTPLHDALWHGYEECARALLDAGARTDLPGHDGRLPHDIALDVFGPGHPLVAELRGVAV